MVKDIPLRVNLFGAYAVSAILIIGGTYLASLDNGFGNVMVMAGFFGAVAEFIAEKHFKTIYFDRVFR